MSLKEELCWIGWGFLASFLLAGLLFAGTTDAFALGTELIKSASGEPEYIQPQSPEEFIPMVQALIKKNKDTKADKDFDIPLPPGTEGNFAPVVTMLPENYWVDMFSKQPYVPEQNTEPIITTINLRDYETVRMYRAWLIEDQNADMADIRFAIFMVNRIVNAPITGQEDRMLSFNELTNPTLYYVILDRDGNLKRKVPVRGMVREEVIRFGFRTADMPKLYLREGDKLLLVLEFSLKEGEINVYDHLQKTIAPAIDLLDPSALRIMEFNLHGPFNSLGWENRAPALPSTLRANAVVGKPQNNQFFLLNPYGTCVFDLERRCEGIFPGDSHKLITQMPIRAQGSGGIWQINEREYVQVQQEEVTPAPEPVEKDTTSSPSLLTELSLAINGKEEVPGMRIEKEDGMVVWLFDMSKASWEGSWPQTRTVEIYASLGQDANPESWTELYFSSISIGWNMFPAGFSFGNMGRYNGLWDAGGNSINVFGTSFPHKRYIDGDGGGSGGGGGKGKSKPKPIDR